MWYCRYEAQFRQALFFSAASVAGAFSGLLAYAIAVSFSLSLSLSSTDDAQKMDGVGGYAGWRWIFILEGLATVVVAVIAFFIIYDFPEKATFLTEDERAWVIHRLRYQGSDDHTRVEEVERFEWKYVRDAFTDWQIYLGLLSVLPSLSSGVSVCLTRVQCTGALCVRCTGVRSSCPLLSRTWAIRPRRRSC